MIRVLYIDDKLFLLENAKTFLERSGNFSVETVTTANGALEKLTKDSYDAVIADYQMPGMDGIEFLKLLRRDYPDLAFLFFTGKGREEIAVEAFEQGADFYVRKGSDSESQFAELVHKVKHAVDNRRMKRQLTMSEERFEDFVRNFEGIAFQTDINGVFLLLEGNVEGITGYSADEIRSCSDLFDRIIHPIDQPHYREARKQLVSVPGFRENVLFRIIRKNGDIRWLHGNIHNIADQMGAITFVQGTLYDITDLKRARDELAKTEAKWRSVITWAPAVIMVLDRNGTILFINKPHPPFSPSQTLGKNMYEYLTPDQRSVLRGALGRVFGTGEVVRFESSINLNGTVTEWYANQISPIMWEAGRPAALMVSTIITERKWLEENLRESEEHYRAIVSATPDGIAILDEEGKIMFSSPRFYEIFDIPPDKNIVGVSSLDYIDPVFQPLARTRIAREFAGDLDAEPCEYLLRKENGTSFWGEIVSSPMRGTDGIITGLLVLIHDITKRKMADEIQQENENYLKTVFSFVQTGLVMIDPQTHEIKDVNPAAVGLIGTDRSKILGAVCHNFICPAERGKCPITDLKQTVDHSERVLLTADGKQMPIIKSVISISIKGRSYLLESLFDITDLKRT
jgi:PAS domain S-box-containing protein